MMTMSAQKVLLRRPRTSRSSTGLDDMNPSDMYDRALVLAKRGRKSQAARVIPLLRAAAGAGHAMASHALATWYIHGIGLRKNFAAAVELEKVAARAGIVEAIYNLAFSYESGRGVAKDPREALRLYRRAARLGDTDAMYEVGRCLFYGVGAPENRQLGRKWIAKSRRAVGDSLRKK